MIVSVGNGAGAESRRGEGCLAGDTGGEDVLASGFFVTNTL